MVRYLHSITQKSSRLFRHVFIHILYRLLFIQYCSVRLLITYLMLVTFSTTVLVYHQSKKLDHTNVPFREEVIQVDRRETSSILLLYDHRFLLVSFPSIIIE